MHMPFRRSKPLPMRMVNAVAATAGTARMVIRRHTQPVPPKHRSMFQRMTRRA
jgi:hypothetical protein